MTGAPVLSLRIDFGPDRRIGPGKIALLEKIAALGSISAAARDLGMSYKRAWDLVEALSQIIGTPVLSTQSGGKRGGGAALTNAGAAVVFRFREIESAAASAAALHLKALATEIK